MPSREVLSGKNQQISESEPVALIPGFVIHHQERTATLLILSIAEANEHQQRHGCNRMDNIVGVVFMLGFILFHKSRANRNGTYLSQKTVIPGGTKWRPVIQLVQILHILDSRFCGNDAITNNSDLSKCHSCQPNFYHRW